MAQKIAFMFLYDNDNDENTKNIMTYIEPFDEISPVIVDTPEKRELLVNNTKGVKITELPVFIIALEGNAPIIIKATEDSAIEFVGKIKEIL